MARKTRSYLQRRPATAKPARSVGNLHRLKISIESSPLIYFIAGTLGFLATVATIGTFLQLYWAFSDRQEELRTMREERIARAWEHLLTRNGGDTGKGGSLSSLSLEGAPFQNIDLSCQSIGAWDAGKCTTRPRFVSAVLRLDDPGATPNFSETTIIRSELKGVSVDAWRFRKTWLFESNLQRARIEKGLDGTRINLSDLTNAEIDIESLYVVTNSNISATRINLSMTPIKEKPGMDQTQSWLKAQRMATNWFWADRPPAAFQRDIHGPDVVDLAKLLQAMGATICDPQRRLQQSDAVWPFWTSLPADAIDLGESRPRIASASSPDNVCPSMTVEEAVARYPDSYSEEYRARIVQRGLGGFSDKPRTASQY